MSADSLTQPAASPVEPGESLLAAAALDAAPRTRWDRLRAHLRERGSAARRTLPRDLALLLLVFLVARHLSLAWVTTPSVHTSLALVIKGGQPQRGELAAFAYRGGVLKDYYRSGTMTQLALALGMSPALDGPKKGDGFLKVLQGLPGDRIELEGRRVFLVTRQGRLFVGECKTHTRYGVPLQMIAPQTIPAGYVYMAAPHPDALDSRYRVMGLVPTTAIVGKGVKLW